MLRVKLKISRYSLLILRKINYLIDEFEPNESQSWYCSRDLFQSIPIEDHKNDYSSHLTSLKAIMVKHHSDMVSDIANFIFSINSRLNIDSLCVLSKTH